MFLYNILTGGSNRQQTTKYDKISFKINLSDNIPQYQQINNEQIIEENKFKDVQVNEKHQLYDQIVKYHLEWNKQKKNQQKCIKKEEQNDNIQQSNKANKQYKQQSNNQNQPINPHIQQKQQKQQEISQFITYICTQNDTIFGLSLKLDIPQKSIRQLNNLSGSIYPAMTIKLPSNIDISKLYYQPQTKIQKVKISDLLSSSSNYQIGYINDNDKNKLNKKISLKQNNQDNNQTEKYQCEYYAGIAGDIKGTITINNNYIIFNPNLQDNTNLSKFSIQKLLKFNAIIQTVDIQGIVHIPLPQINQSQQQNEQISQNQQKQLQQDIPSINHIIQIYLYTVGNNKIQKKYKQRLDKLKHNKKAIASINFSFKLIKNQKQAEKYCRNICNKINSIICKIQQEQKLLQKSEELSNKEKQRKKLTNIPFFDIIHENIHPKIKEQMQNIQNQDNMNHNNNNNNNPNNKSHHKSPSKPITSCILNQPSDIISDLMFSNLSPYFPLLYQHCNWSRIYSSTLNGTSFHTFLTRSKNQYPLILLIKQYKGYQFGSFIIQPLQTGKTGRGEMFIFTFRNYQNIPQVFKWTTKNQFFVYIEKDKGIGIGMGLKYGIFVKSTMDKGSSASTITFGNTQTLSKKEDFVVEEVELWAVDQNI